MQKLEKIRPSRSSLDTSPVISPKRLVRVAQFLRHQFARMPRRQQLMGRLDVRPRAAQRIDVPGSCRERAVRCGMKADAVLEVLTQPVEART